MRGLHTRNFFWQWHAAYAASNPGHGKNHWQGVSWTKERHAYWGARYSMQHEVHCLERRNGGKIDWQIMVVIERWWGPDKDKGIRDISWCKLVSGRADRVLSWLRKQETPRTRPVVPTEDMDHHLQDTSGQ
jgi:hypothetical protein